MLLYKYIRIEEESLGEERIEYEHDKRLCNEDDNNNIKEIWNDGDFDEYYEDEDINDIMEINGV